MILQRLWEAAAAERVAAEAQPLMRSMFPLCRSITGNGVRRTLDLVEQWTPLKRTEVPTGTALFDWEVPKEWNIRDAYVSDAGDRRVVDFRQHNLHVVSYSMPVDRTLSLAELEPHLHSLPDHPDWIPFRTSYYREQWGFCLRHRDRMKLGPGPFRVRIDSELAAGSLTYAEAILEGSTSGEAIVYTHTCHPSLANDNLTGIAIAAALARELRQETPRLTWRFVFGPGTIGSLAWLSRNEGLLPRLRGGFVIGLLGDRGALTYKRSRNGAAATDRAAEHVLRASGAEHRTMDFEPYGYDERQFCSPGFDLPIGRLTRSANGAYPEYHTSADDLDFIRTEKLAESLTVLARMMAALDANRSLQSLHPRGEPRLGKRGLYGAVGGTSPSEMEHALLWVMNLADGQHDLVAMAKRSGLSIELLDRAATALEDAQLVRGLEERVAESRRTVR
jgi:aminopeptidase-like protein